MRRVNEHSSSILSTESRHCDNSAKVRRASCWVTATLRVYVRATTPAPNGASVALRDGAFPRARVRHNLLVVEELAAWYERHRVALSERRIAAVLQRSPDDGRDK